MKITNQYNDNMIPCIIFGENSFCYIFVDPANNTCVKSEDAITEWLTQNNIAVEEFANHCMTEYNSMKDMNVEQGIISYFSKDDETIYNYSKNIDVADSFKEIFNY